MPTDDVLPELKEIMGAMIFGVDRPLSVNEMRRCLKEVAAEDPDRTGVFADVTKRNLRDALEALKRDLVAAKCGFELVEVAGGFQLQSDRKCSVWLKHLLKMGKPQRLSRPALETLAIVAYRQPVTKAVIEQVRGVSVDHLVKTLMELQLVRIVGRSDLPGRPFLYGTTQLFLEHFGLRNLDELDDIEPMLRLKQEQKSKGKAKGKRDEQSDQSDQSDSTGADEEVR